VEAKAKDLEGVLNVLSDSDVKKGVDQMIKIAKKYPNPSGGKHLLQFHTMSSPQANSIRNLLITRGGQSGIINILNKVDVVSFQ